MLKLWLPPKTWFHGSQSRITGGRSPRKGSPARICAWFTHIIRCVVITPLGLEVEPEVIRILASVSGPTLSRAASTDAPARAWRSASSGVAPEAPGRLETTSMPCSAGSASAAPYCSASTVKRSFGATSSATCRSRSCAPGTSEYCSATGTVGTPTYCAASVSSA
jgi:hypothetical protein